MASESSISEVFDDIMDECERLADALTETHRALGGDGEWCAKPGSMCAAGETGDLAIDCPALATALRARVAALEAKARAYDHAVQQAKIKAQEGRTNAELVARVAELEKALGVLVNRWRSGAALADRIPGSPADVAIRAIKEQLRECASGVEAALRAARGEEASDGE